MNLEPIDVVVVDDDDDDDDDNNDLGISEEEFVPLNDTSTLRAGVEICVCDSSSVGSAWAPTSLLDESNARGRPPLTVTTEFSNVRDHDISQKERTLPDKLADAAAGAGSSAFWSSLELLKLAGGWTLSTTGKLVAPPLKVTQEFVLPSIWNAAVDYACDVIPTRVQDWFRIVSASVHHLVTVLRNTKQGQIFQNNVLDVASDVLDCCSSEESRQLITDLMANMVKLFEALHTPEFQSFLDQTTIVGTRLVDAAASGRTKQLLHDTNKAIWSLIELLSDSHTIIALAEVTATLCHTLEMEDAVHRQQISRLDKAQRRYARNEFTSRTYTERDLLQSPGVSPEEAIVSGLGSQGEISTQCELSYGKELEPTNQFLTSESKVGREWERIGSEYLKETIIRRGDRLPRSTAKADTHVEGKSRRVPYAMKSIDIGSNEDIEDLVTETFTEEGLKESIKVPPRQVYYNDHEIAKLKSTLSSTSCCKPDTTRPFHYRMEGGNFPDDTPEHFIEPEPSVSRFYNSLEKMLAERRAESLRDLVIGAKQRKNALTDDRGEKTWEQAITTVKALNLISKAGSKNEKDSMQGRLMALRRATLEEDHGAVQSLLDVNEKRGQKRKTKALLLIVLLILIILVVWVVLGFYGLYVLIKPWWFDMTKSPSLNELPREISIRILKEIVYVNQNSGITSQSIDEDVPIVDDTALQQCLSNAFQ